MGELSLSGDLSVFETGASRETILALEQKAREIDSPAECPLEHFFAPGLYARQIFMPAGAVVIGKIHKHAHINTISKGRVLVTTEFGRDELAAPVTFVSKPGTKRAVLVLEDCIWTTYHPTNETDIERIEDEVISPSYEQLDAFLEHQKSLEVL